MARRVKVEIRVQNLSEPLAPFRSLVLVQNLYNHHSFEIRLPYGNFSETESEESNLEEENDPIKDPGQFIGKNITIVFGEGENENRFQGIITEVIHSKYDWSKGDLILKGASPTVLLESGKQCHSFLDKTLEQITEFIKSDIPGNLLNLIIKPVFQDPIEYFVQYKETSFQFLRRLAATYGEWLYYDGQNLVFGERSTLPSMTLNFRKDISNLNLSLRLIPLDQEKIGQYYVDSNDSFNSSSSEFKVQGLDNFGSIVIDETKALFSQNSITEYAHPIKDKENLDEVLKLKKSSKAAEMVVLNGSCDSPVIKCGGYINVTVGSSDITWGEYFITSVTHTTDGIGNYQNNFEAIPTSLSVPPAPRIGYPVCEPQYATVVRNYEEPSEKEKGGLGRVQVRLLWQDKDNNESTPWIRILTPHAGDKKGFYFIPEIGEEVLVGFEQNNPNRPYVIGSLYHGKAKPDWNDEENNIKALKTRSGNLIIFNDKEEKETITIQNKDPHNIIVLTMEEKGKITIEAITTIEMKAKESISLHAKQILLMADEKVEIIAMKSGETEENGTNGKENAVESILLHSKEIKMNAEEKIEVAAKEIEEKSSEKMTLDGGETTNISAGTVNIN